MKAPVSAIVTAFRRTEQTLTTLRCLAACIPAPAEIIVHVDGNELETLQYLKREFNDAVYILSASNLGPGGGRNKLVNAATQPIVASFDDDSYPLDLDYFSRVVALFECLSEMSLITGRIFHQDETQEPSEATLESSSDFSGGACVFRREAFLSTCGYVPLPIAYGMEEVDLALRLHASGHHILKTSWLRIFHDTNLKRHDAPEVTAGSVANIFLLTFLRYPVTLWPIGLAQVAKRLFWLMTHGRSGGIISGLLRTPACLFRNRSYRLPLTRQEVTYYLSLRRHPEPFPWPPDLED